MAGIVMHLHLKPLAEAAFTARKTSIMSQRRIGIINSDRARVLLDELYREFYTTDNMEPADPERSIGATCPICKRLHIMPATVSRFRCECRPYEQHLVAPNLTVDGGVHLPKPDRVIDAVR